MSEVILKLKASSDPLENDLAIVYEHWQAVKRKNNEFAGLGYEPRDINAKGAIKVISSRVLKASSGFEEVDHNQSYEALVLKYPERFTTDVIDAATKRLELGASKAVAFLSQDIQFFVKASSFELFGESEIPSTKENWIGRQAIIPPLIAEHEYADNFLKNGFRSLVWLHEKGRHGEKGRGLTAIVQFGEMDRTRKSHIIDAYFFERPVGNEVLISNKDNNDFIASVRGYNPTRTWPISDEAVSILLKAARDKVHLFAEYEKQNPDPNNPLNLERIEDVTGLRQMIIRRNQSAFRKALLTQRPNCCAITGTNELTVLEAAHIIPFAEKFADRDKLENGLLLRSDIHKLFDAHLITIHPETRKVEMAASIRSADYTQLKGRKIEDDLSMVSLKYHFEKFSEKKRTDDDI